MKVVLGLGGTEESIRALEETIERGVAVGDVLIVAVLDKVDAPRSQREMADEAARILAAADLDGDVRLVEGEPGPALVDLAEAEDADQIVIGGGVETPMGKIRLGPITEFVLLNAPTTVKLVR